jgi:hypothetical protein
MYAQDRFALWTPNPPAAGSSGNTNRLRRSLAMTLLITSVALTWGTGCAATWNRLGSALWVADYDTAEQQARESGRSVLILYKDARLGTDDSIERALKAPTIEERTNRYVRCVLFKSYEPDRRYVAQFGVERTPALILVHPDGTYHAQSGMMSEADVRAFLASAIPPGLQPLLDPLIPREPRYLWHTSLDEAEAVVRRTGRPMAVVFHRTLTRDWARLEPLLNRHEVSFRLAPMVHCRIGLMRFLADAYITRFGALKLPAIVIAHPDGTYDALELPTSYVAIARFVDASLAAPGTSEGRRANGVGP